MGLMDFFTPEAGQDRRRWLDSQEAALAEALRYYLGPTGIPERLGVANEMLNPVVGLQRSAAATNRALDPSLGGAERVAAGADAATEALGALLGVSGLRATTEAVAPTVERGLMDFIADESGSVPVPGFRPPSAVSGLEQHAAGIVDLLRSGRADEITDAMLDLGDPVMNARLNEALWQNYDLPMDYASRMERAKQMGHAAEYHGTTTGSEMRYPRSDFGSGSRKGIGFVTSSDPYVSSSYADPLYGSVFPMMNKVPEGGFPTVSAGGEIWSQIPGDALMTYGGREFPVSSYARGPADVGGVYDTNQVSRGAAIEGHPGVQFTDLVDRSIHAPRDRNDPSLMREFQTRSSEPSTVTMRHDTRGMRSKFARFDPRLAHLKNLNAALAGGAGIPIGLLAMQPNEEQY